jgi:hypothetical protein
MNKAETLLSQTSCLNKAEPEEPLFILRGHDRVAAQTVRHWATMAVGIHEPDKIKQALQIAEDMDAWRNKQMIEDAPKYDNESSVRGYTRES